MWIFLSSVSIQSSLLSSILFCPFGFLIPTLTVLKYLDLIASHTELNVLSL